MKLETVGQRHRLIDGMIKRGFDFEESLISDEEHGDDWSGAMHTVENLITIEEMIRAEIFLQETYGQIEEIRSRTPDEQMIFLDIVDDGLVRFVDTILLRRIEFTFDYLNDWEFETAGGKKFKKNYCKKLDELMKKYQDLYDL